MGVAIVTGAGGLIGSEAARHFAQHVGLHVIGFDNDMRSMFFGPEASTAWNVARLQDDLGDRYRHVNLDIRDREGVDRIFSELGDQVKVIIHTAAQPSHDWAAKEPLTDFTVNALGTLIMLESARAHAKESPFIFTSTNKVYGDRPNSLPFIEMETRYELPSEHPWHCGIDESMSIDATLHSVFGASKVAADVMVQEYGRYFGMPTVCFRGGTLTGPAHSASELHGFLAYVMQCAVTGRPYTVFGYRGKQVRDVIHSYDVVRAFEKFYLSPSSSAVYNLGGGRQSNCSVLEAIALCEDVSGKRMDWALAEDNRIGDHVWWIGDNGRLEREHPDWCLTYDLRRIAEEIFEAQEQKMMWPKVP